MNWIEKQRESFKSINMVYKEHPEYLEARKQMGLTDEIQFASGRVVNGDEEYFFGGLITNEPLEKNSNDENISISISFTFIIFSLDEIGVLYEIDERMTAINSQYPFLNKIIK